MTAGKKPTEPVIETCAEGHHVARYRMKLYRFLLSDGTVLDVSAIRDDSDLRAAVLARFAAKDVSIAGMTRLAMDELIAESSLGTPEALARRAETPPETTAEILDGIDDA